MNSHKTGIYLMILLLKY